MAVLISTELLINTGFSNKKSVSFVYFMCSLLPKEQPHETLDAIPSQSGTQAWLQTPLLGTCTDYQSWSTLWHKDMASEAATFEGRNSAYVVILYRAQYQVIIFYSVLYQPCEEETYWVPEQYARCSNFAFIVFFLWCITSNRYSASKSLLEEKWS